MADDFKHDCNFRLALNATIATLASGIRNHSIDSETYWLKLSPRCHIAHAMVHLNKHLANMTDEDHLGHAFCRLLMAVELTERERLSAKEDRTDG